MKTIEVPFQKKYKKNKPNGTNSSPWFKLDTQFNLMRLLQKKKWFYFIMFFTSACLDFETIHMNLITINNGVLLYHF